MQILKWETYIASKAEEEYRAGSLVGQDPTSYQHLFLDSPMTFSL